MATTSLLTRIVSLAALSLLFTACFGDNPADPDTTEGTRPSGTIYMSDGGNVQSVDLATGIVTTLFAGQYPHRTPEGTFIVRTHRGLEEVSADGTTSRIIVESNIEHPNDETYDDDFRNPQLSSDGRFIAYEGQFGYRYDFYVVDRQNGELLLEYYDRATGAGMERPTWTPDNRIVVAGNSHNPGLYISDKSWENLTRIDPDLNDPAQPIVSPDGSRVAFVMNRHIYMMNIDGTGLKQITTSGREESWPTWSPDGTWIASYGNSSILFYPLNGTDYFDLRSLHPTATISTGGWQFQWQ